MPRQPKKIEYEGEVWTTARMSETFKCHVSYAQELVRDVEGGRLTVAQIFGRLKRHRNNHDRKNRKFVFKFRRRKRVFTMKGVARTTGLSEESAFRRLVKTERGERDPNTLLDPPRSKRYAEERTRKPRGRFSHLSSEMTPERRRRADLLADANMGLISQNEFLRN